MDEYLVKKVEKGFFPLRYKSIILAFSGGVDSTVVAKLLQETQKNKRIKLITVISEWISSFEIREAKTIAEQLGMEHDILKISSESTHEFWKNPPNRCFYCKMTIFSHLRDYAKKNDYDVVIDGTNASDIQGHRPGLKALEELGVYSPLLQSGLLKDEVRKIAAYYNLSVTNKPAMACLASRIPYGDRISPERLKRVELGEKILRKYKISKQFRLRDHGEIARIEINPEEITGFLEKDIKKIIIELKKLGYYYITLDLEGYRPALPKER
jgi:uncharacterized protein